MKKKIIDAQDADGWSEELAAINDLTAKRELTRPSDVSTQSFIKYKDFLEKQAMGDEIRREREHIEWRKEQNRQEQLRTVQAFVARGHREAEEMKVFKEMRDRSIEMAGKTQRDLEAKLEQKRLREKRLYARKMRKRVDEQKHLNARLAVSEASQDAEERKQGSVMRLQIGEALKKSREDEERALRERASSAREARREAVRKASARSHREKAHLVREQRQEEQREPGEQRLVQIPRGRRRRRLLLRRRRGDPRPRCTGRPCRRHRAAPAARAAARHARGRRESARFEVL